MVAVYPLQATETLLFTDDVQFAHGFDPADRVGLPGAPATRSMKSLRAV